VIEFSQSNDERLRKMALFDAIINNTDRKIGHLLPTKAGEIFGCDHGVTFHVEDKLRTVLWQWRGITFNQNEIDQLQRFITDFSKWCDLISELLTDEEKEITKQRVLDLLDSGKFPFPSEDWPAIPWPPV
jgi:uncharacterized repeat protein (TIGR03843 family)